jgi:hypothetical protein
MPGIKDKVVVITDELRKHSRAGSGIGEAIEQPPDVDVGEIIVHPTAQA